MCLLKSKVKVASWTTRTHEAGMSQGIPVSIAMAHKGMMSLAPCQVAFNSLLWRYPSQLCGPEMHQKSQAETWIQTSDPWHRSLVTWPLGHCAIDTQIILWGSAAAKTSDYSKLLNCVAHVWTIHNSINTNNNKLTLEYLQLNSTDNTAEETNGC